MTPPELFIRVMACQKNPHYLQNGKGTGVMVEWIVKMKHLGRLNLGCFIFRHGHC